MTTPEKETLQLMQARDGRRCPNCFLVIEKDGGCNAMYCEGCKTYFDWATAASAVPGSRMVDEHGVGGEAVVCEMEALAVKREGSAVTLADTMEMVEVALTL
jgi:hypothetical protein